MRILAIDTSCDDTAIAVMAAKIPASNSSALSSLPRGFQFPKVKILSNVVSSQVKSHAKYGGVYPALAKREHQKNLVLVLTKTLLGAECLLKSKCQNPNVPKGKPPVSSEAGKPNPKHKKKLDEILAREEILRPKLLAFLGKYQKPKVDAIAVTVGPGLEPCLWQGINFAQALATWWNLPIIPVNHIEGHLLANFIGEQSPPTTSDWFPLIGLVVSGGHTELILTRGIGKYKIIGQTRDDAAGECFDKTARILGLPYPGGPAVAALAATALKAKNSKFKVELPRPMIKSNNFDFSFSGLKTAVLYDWMKRKKEVQESLEYKTLMAREIQQAIIDVLIKKTIQTAKNFRAKSIILGGGVAANEELRRQFLRRLQTPKKNKPSSKDTNALRDRVPAGQAANCQFNFCIPPKNLCLDNAAMIAVAGYCNRQKATRNFSRLQANGNLRIS